MKRKDFLSQPRPIDRAPQLKRHEGPYYGDDLKKLLEGIEPGSLVERLSEFYYAIPTLVAVIFIVAMAAAVTFAFIAFI
jgi:hypothetical protein